MRKWHSYFEILQFPLILLFIACVLKGAGGMILNPSFQIFFGITNKWVVLCAEMFRYIGIYLINLTPFIFLIATLSKTYEDSIPTLIGVITYILFNVSTMFFSTNTLASTVYQAELGISIDASGMMIAGSGMRYPLATGILAVFIALLTTRYFYTGSRRSSNIGPFAFVSRDASALINASVLSLVLGFGCAYAWPYVVGVLYRVFDFIARDITNPVNLFIYGIVERIMAMCDLDRIIHAAFWFGERGGSWVFNGVTYLGDVSIWTAQIANGIFNTGFGRFITPYYVQNIFIVPALIIATFRTFTDKVERSRFVLFLFISIFVSVICGDIFPFEVYLLISCPLFYIFHLIATGALYAVLQALQLQYGYSFTGNIAMATPGSIFGFLLHIRDTVFTKEILSIMAVGLVFAIVYYAAMTYYYKTACMDLLGSGEKEDYIRDFIASLGGLDNITRIYSSPTKIILQAEDASLLDFRQMQHLGAYKVIEKRTTFEISFGAISYMMANEINKLKEKQD